MESADTLNVQGFRIAAPQAPHKPGIFVFSPTDQQRVAQAKIGGPVEYHICTLIFFWENIYRVEAHESSVAQSVSYISGVSSSRTLTSALGKALSIGPYATAEIVGDHLSIAFSQQSNESHAISLHETRTITTEFEAPPNTTLQVWQLQEWLEVSPSKPRSRTGALSFTVMQSLDVLLSKTFPPR